MLSKNSLLPIVVIGVLLAAGSSSQADEWVVQEDPDAVGFAGCWSVFPTNYLCDGEPYLIDGDYETRSFSYVNDEDAILWSDYQVPADVEIAKWFVVFEHVDPFGTGQEIELIIDIASHPAAVVQTRIIVHNSGTVGSPFSFDYFDGDEWVGLHADITDGSLVSALVFEERMEWYVTDPLAPDASSWSSVKALFH